MRVSLDMLPVEGLTEVVSFLPLYDLDSVLLADRRLSNIASKCVKNIRVWHFDDVGFVVTESSVISLMGGDDDDGHDTLIAVEGRESTVDLLDIALHNALFKVLSFVVSPYGVIPLPSKSALMVEKLELHVDGVPTADFLVDIIARFRKVQTINLYQCDNITDFSPVIDLCRQKGIRSVINFDGVDLMAEP